MAWYRSGTVTAAAGQNVITGTGTQWANNVMGVAPGQALVVQRSDGNTLIYEILAVDSNTKIRINGNVVDALSASNYGIQTSVANSYSALARETSAQLALYQQLLQDWQLITTGTGNVSIIAPDGTEVVIPALSWITDSKTWFDANRELIDSVNPDLLMHTTGGTFTGPVILAGDATDPKGAVTKQQLEARQKFVILYPEGTEAAPATLGVNQRKTIANPFPGRRITAIVEILLYGNWGATTWIFNGSNNTSSGALAHTLGPTGKDVVIIVQAAGGTIYMASIVDGNPFAIASGSAASAPFRVRVSTED